MGISPEEFCFGLCLDLINAYNGVFVSGLISKSNILLTYENNLILQIYPEYLILFYKT